MSIERKAELPPNPTLKDINFFKKHLNWGELPPFYHLVASSLGESQGILTHGFDTAIKRIIDKRNWNLDLLGGYIDEDSNIHCSKRPRIALYQLFTDRGFELQAFPYAMNKEIDQYVRENRLMEFKIWDPLNMKMILRINQMHKFIEYYFQRGDEADKALIIYAHRLVHRVIEFTKNEVDVVKVDGVSIKQYYELLEKRQVEDHDALLMAGLQGNFSDFRK